MRTVRVRAGWMLTTAAILGMCLPVLAQRWSHPYIARGLDSNSPARAGAEGPPPLSEADARTAEIKVELAWLANQLTYPCMLAARVQDGKLEVGGQVPNPVVRQQALLIARDHSGLPIVDKLTVQPAAEAPTVRVPDAVLCRQAVASLAKAFPSYAYQFHVEAAATGQITVLGTIPSYEEKLAVSRRLSQLEGCTAVYNQLTIDKVMSEGKAPVPVSDASPTRLASSGPATDSVKMISAPPNSASQEERTAVVASSSATKPRAASEVVINRPSPSARPTADSDPRPVAAWSVEAPRTVGSQSPVQVRVLPRPTSAGTTYPTTLPSEQSVIQAAQVAKPYAQASSDGIQGPKAIDVPLVAPNRIHVPAIAGASEARDQATTASEALTLLGNTQGGIAPARAATSEIMRPSPATEQAMISSADHSKGSAAPAAPVVRRVSPYGWTSNAGVKVLRFDSPPAPLLTPTATPASVVKAEPLSARPRAAPNHGTSNPSATPPGPVVKSEPPPTVYRFSDPPVPRATPALPASKPEVATTPQPVAAPAVAASSASPAAKGAPTAKPEAPAPLQLAMANLPAVPAPAPGLPGTTTARPAAAEAASGVRPAVATTPAPTAAKSVVLTSATVPGEDRPRPEYGSAKPPANPPATPPQPVTPPGKTIPQVVAKPDAYKPVPLPDATAPPSGSKVPALQSATGNPLVAPPAQGGVKSVAAPTGKLPSRDAAPTATPLAARPAPAVAAAPGKAPLAPTAPPSAPAIKPVSATQPNAASPVLPAYSAPAAPRPAGSSDASRSSTIRVEAASVLSSAVPRMLQQRIERVCTGQARDVQVVPESSNSLLVRMKVRNIATGQQVGQKVLSLPELAPYQVKLEVQIAQ